MRQIPLVAKAYSEIPFSLHRLIRLYQLILDKEPRVQQIRNVIRDILMEQYNAMQDS
jgi:hypothetical protein